LVLRYVVLSCLVLSCDATIAFEYIMSEVDVVDILRLGTESNKGYRRKNFQRQAFLSRERRTKPVLVVKINRGVEKARCT
jgi:hypothetical protein